MSACLGCRPVSAPVRPGRPDRFAIPGGLHARTTTSDLESLSGRETTVRSALTDLIHAAEEVVPHWASAGVIVVPT
jgi:hypothetical protein